jgi:hypothetical protein
MTRHTFEPSERTTTREARETVYRLCEPLGRGGGAPHCRRDFCC